MPCTALCTMSRRTQKVEVNKVNKLVIIEVVGVGSLINARMTGWIAKV